MYSIYAVDHGIWISDIQHGGGEYYAVCDRLVSGKNFFLYAWTDIWFFATEAEKGWNKEKKKVQEYIDKHSLFICNLRGLESTEYMPLRSTDIELEEFVEWFYCSSKNRELRTISLTTHADAANRKKKAILF